MADLIRMKWTNIRGKHVVFVRMKTEKTKHAIEEIASPISPKVQGLLDKIGDKDSPYILGYLNDGYSESSFRNKLQKARRITNQNLKYVCEKLDLSVKLDLVVPVMHMHHVCIEMEDQPTIFQKC